MSCDATRAWSVRVVVYSLTTFLALVTSEPARANENTIVSPQSRTEELLQSPRGGEKTMPGVGEQMSPQLLMKVRDESRALKAAQAIGGVRVSKSGLPGWYAVFLGEGTSLEEALSRGRQHPLIEIIEPNFKAEALP